LALLYTGGVAAHLASLLEYAFPISALVAAALLFRSAPASYMCFAWWIWFLTPGLRRYLDYWNGWSLVTPIALTPYLVSGVALFSVARHLPKLRRMSLAPFALLLGGVAYGWIVGVSRLGFLAGTYGTISWLVPVGFGLHIATASQKRSAYLDGIQQAFLWGLLVVSLYALFQYVAPPAWDIYWMANAPMFSIGQPMPYQVRVFSTLNSPGPFAVVLAVGLLLLLANRSVWRWPIGTLGVVALLLTLVRGVWVCWLVGLAVYIAYLPWRTKWRLAAVLAIAGLAVTLLVFDPSFESVRTRVLTLTDLANDRSLSERVSLVSRIVQVIVTTPFGGGLGATGVSVSLQNAPSGIRDFDNGILETLYSLGWVFGGVFLFGTAWLLLRGLGRGESSDDRLTKAVRASAVCIAATAGTGDAFSSVSGMLLWTCLGLLASGQVVRERAWRAVPVGWQNGMIPGQAVESADQGPV
jgi:hypothetical protein